MKLLVKLRPKLSSRQLEQSVVDLYWPYSSMKDWENLTVLERYEQLTIVNTNNQLATGLSLRRVATPPHIPTGHCVV